MALGDITAGPVTYAAGTNTPRHPAPALTAEEARTVARFDAAPVPAEVVAETVAYVLGRHVDGLRGQDGRPNYTARKASAAAIAALPPSPAEEAVRRVEALVEHMSGSGSSVYRKAAKMLRAALASPAPQTVTIDVADARAGEPEDYRAVPVDAPQVLMGDAGRASYPPAPAPQGGPNISDTCCGRCPGSSCYVDQVTGA